MENKIIETEIEKMLKWKSFVEVEHDKEEYLSPIISRKTYGFYMYIVAYHSDSSNTSASSNSSRIRPEARHVTNRKCTAKTHKSSGVWHVNKLCDHFEKNNFVYRFIFIVRLGKATSYFGKLC